MPTVREFELALQNDPAQTEAFVALRKTYRQAGKHDKLVSLYERRAQAIDDGPKAAELFYLAAELRLDQLGDPEGAEADLANAVDRDPAHVKATQRLKDIYREQGRTNDYLTMLEMEAGAVARTKDPARLTELQNEMAQLFVNHFARLERAVRNPQRPGKLSVDQVKSVESGRKIYRALGDYRNAVRLYELELEATPEAKRRADLLLGLGRVLAEKLGELDAAAQRLGEVVRLRPRDERALELLASIYANPQWIGADGLERAAAIYFQVARRRHEAGDAENAVASLRKALQAAPRHPEASELLERVYYGAQRFQDLDRYYRERVAEAATVEEKMDFLFKRAQLGEGELGDRAEALRVYEEIATLEAPGGPAAARLHELYTENGAWGKLAELREKQLEIIEDVGQRVAVMQELASMYRDRLGDRDQCAVYLHAVLELEPTNAQALQGYADHFRDKGDWKALTDLLEFSFESAKAGGAGVEELVRRLEEVAGINDKNLGDPERALATWQRIEELAPGYERAREAQKRILQKGKQWDRMASVLEREAKGAKDPAQRGEILRRMAQIQREKMGDAGKAIATYKELLRTDPQDQVALRSLVEIYEREGDFAGLAKTLRQQLDAAVTKQERVNLLRRLLVIYDERLTDLVEGSWTATEILKLVPGDREALNRLEGILERSDDMGRLVQTLEYHTRYAATVEEKIQIVRRIAEILQTRVGDLAAAAERWEQVARLSPDEGEALDVLAGLYQQLDKGADLARVLDLQVERLADDPARQAEYLRSLAQLAGGTLREPRRALRAWEALLEILPADPEALEAVARLYTERSDWSALAGILERQVPLAADPAQALALALRRAALLEEKLFNPDEAARALEQVITELDPRSLEAHQHLRRLYEAKNDWARVVKVAERQLFLTEEPASRAARSLEIGALWRDRLQDARKAITAFERALEIDAESGEALRALAVLYAGAGESERLIVTDEKLLHQTEDPAERRRLMMEIGRACEESLAEPRLAFEWYRRVYNETFDPEALKLVDKTAETYALWDDLIQVYEGARSRAREPFEQVAASLKIAALCEEKMQDPARAFGVLRDALPADPAGRRILPELERLAGITADWAGLLDVYARVARGRPDLDDRVDLLRLRAGVREERMKDARGALDECLRSFALHPTNEATRNEILRLAEITSRWEDALKVQAQIFAQAPDQAAKLEVARHAAALVEEKVKDPIRAFRAYLNAFRLAPDDEDVVANLWRLAAVIGRYEEAPVIPPAAAKVLAAVGTDAPVPADANIADDDDVAEEIDADEVLQEVSGVFEVEADEGEGGSVEVDSGAILLETRDETDVTARTTSKTPAVAAPPPPPPPPLRRGAMASPFETPWEELAQAYETLPAADTAARFDHLMKAADVWERGQKDVIRTLDALERAFKLDSADQTARDRLTRIAGAHGEWDRVCDIWLSAIDDLGRIDHAVGLHHDVARFREALGQMSEAEQRYRAILALKPDHAAALDRMEEILRSQERWSDLSGLLERRTSGPLEALPAGRERRRKYRELAELYETRLEKPYEAIDTLERYVSEAADDDRGADSADVIAETREACEALARLYSKVGLWAKVIETLQHEVEVVADPRASRSQRLRVAEIYEKELGLADRAVEAYESLVAAVPDDEQALLALDRLHESHGRFDDLQDILGRRAKLAADGRERIEIVRRRAKILEDKLGNPDAAASCLRDLGEDALRDDELAAALVRNLRRAALSHEAVRVLEQRLQGAIPGEAQAGGAAGKAATTAAADLQLELAAIRLDDIGDPRGARDAIEAALRMAPESPAALAALARLHLKENDFRAFANTRVREAAALAGKPEAVAALLEAGRAFREQVSDAAEARACFEKALTEDPRSADALRALAALLASQGQWTEAKALFHRQLETAETPQARAAVLTDLARAAWEGSGDAAEATRTLDEALTLAPDHLPAVMTMADIYYKESQWELAERRLNEALRRLRGQPEQMARLYHRLAEVYDKLGKLEEGYRQLLEADRMTPGQLLIKVSLGENRFRARKWRETAMHLAGVADHPDAPAYPDEVAQALSHGAQAEVKLRRPERAIALYEAALRLLPDHTPSIRALADLALERGEKREAATYLRRMAEASGDRAERAALFEQLGDLHSDLGDPAQARTCYEWALGMFEKPTDAQIPLLEKTQTVQKSEGDLDAAARTADMLIALVQNPKERAERRRQAAALLAERGEASRAAALLKQALVDNPEDESAIAGLCEAYTIAGDTDAAADLLDETLPRLPALADGTPKARAERAALWERLGKLHQLRTGDRAQAAAAAAFEQSLAADPERPDARVALVALYGDRAEHSDAVMGHHRMLLTADMTRAASLRALGQGYARAGRVDPARCCFEVLALFGSADADDLAFMAAHPTPVFKADDPYAGILDDAERKRWLAHPESTVMAEIFASIWEGAPGLAGVGIDAFGVTAQDKVSPMSDRDVGKISGQIAKAFGNKRTSLYVSSDPAHREVAVAAHAPPAIVIGPRLAGSDAPAPEVRFEIGRGLELTRPEYILAAGVRPKELTQLLAGLLKAFHPRHARRRAGATDTASEQAAKLKKALPYKVSKRLVELFSETGSTAFSSARWRTVVHDTGNRAGFLACGDLRQAVRLVLGEPAADAFADGEGGAHLREAVHGHAGVRELLRFAISEEYFRLRERLGTAAVTSSSVKPFAAPSSQTAAPTAPSRNL